MEYYMKFFHWLHHCGVNADDPLFRFVIHYLFKALINEELERFRQSWNIHKVRTMKSIRNPISCLYLQSHLYPPPVEVDDKDDKDNNTMATTEYPW